jgi:hypothetical protein
MIVIEIKDMMGLYDSWAEITFSNTRNNKKKLQ